MTTAEFDRVVVDEGSETHTLSRDQFCALPLSMRVRYVLQGNLRFYDGDREIDKRRALQSLMDD